MKAFYFLIIASLCLFSCREETPGNADLYSAIPQSSVIIIESAHFADALNKLNRSRIYLDMDSIETILEFQHKLEELKSLLPPDSLQAFLDKRKGLMSFSPGGAKKYNFLFALPATPAFSKMAIKQLGKTYEHRAKAYSDTEILSFYKDDKEWLSLCVTNNILLISENITLIEEGVRQLNTGFNFKNDKEFAKLYNTANKKDLANIFINLKALPDWLDKAMPRLNNDFIGRIGNWAEMDLQLHSRELLMNGLILIQENEPNYLKSFVKSSAQHSEAELIIPSNTALWISHTFQNAEEYMRSYEEYLKSAGNYQRHKQLLDEHPHDLKEKLLKWVDTEFGIIHTSGSLPKSQKIAYFKFRDQKLAENSLKTISDSSFIEGYRGYIIQQLASDYSLSRLYGSLFRGITKPYYILLDGYVIFSDNPALLKGTVNDIIAGRTIGSTEEFQNFKSQLNTSSHINIIASNPAFLDLWASNLDPSPARKLEQYKENLKNFSWAALQLNVKDEVAYLNFFLLNQPKAEEEVIREWSTVLESPVASEPQLVKNHTTRQYEVFVQDADFRIYLINKNGEILWKRQLDGPILGGLTQVDVFKNNKLQMAFNTANSLYLIDRLGRDVENFPVKLPQNATAAAGVFNYDKARNYRIIIPAGQTLLNYGIDGKPVKGWAFKKAKSKLVSQPQLFSINNKDVIVVLNENGNLHLLNRKGEDRFPMVEGLTDVRPPFYLREGEKLKESELIANTEDGKMAVISFNGVVDRLYLEESRPADHLLYFDDKYIFSSGNDLLLKSTDKPWSVEVKSGISTTPKVMIYRGDLYVASYSEGAEQINLFNKNGELIKGFPVYAQGPFDMGSLKQDGSINIISSSADGTLLCYKVR